jgi:tetratricopeptide (TPR) repeat protein
MMGDEHENQAKLVEQALKYEKQKKYDKAFDKYLKVYSKNTKNKPALIALASLSFRLNRYDDAIMYYEKLAEFSNDYLIWYNLGCIHYKNQNYKEAILILEKSHKINKKFISSLVIMALSYGRLKQYKASKGCFDKVLKIDPNNELTLSSLAVIYFEEKRYEQVLDATEKILVFNPQNHHIRKLKARALSQLDRYEESAKEMKDISSKSKSYQDYTNYVVSLSHDIYTDKYGSIDSKIENLVNKKSEAPEDFISLSLCCLLKGNSDDAIDYLYKARELAKK